MQLGIYLGWLINMEGLHFSERKRKGVDWGRGRKVGGEKLGGDEGGKGNCSMTGKINVLINKIIH